MNWIRIMMLYYMKIIIDKEFKDRVKLILRSDVPKNIRAGHPVQYLRSSHFYVMMLRYAILLNEVKDKIVVDTGCGLGWGSYILAGSAHTVIGIDIDMAAVRYAKEHWKGDKLFFWNRDVINISISDEFADIVTSMEVMEHMHPEDCRKYLNEIGRILVKGGQLFGTSGFTNDREHASQMMASNPDHVHIYGLGEFAEMLKEAGFVNVRIYDNWFFAARKPDG